LALVTAATSLTRATADSTTNALAGLVGNAFAANCMEIHVLILFLEFDAAERSNFFRSAKLAECNERCFDKVDGVGRTERLAEDVPDTGHLANCSDGLTGDKAGTVRGGDQTHVGATETTLNLVRDGACFDNGDPL